MTSLGTGCLPSSFHLCQTPPCPQHPFITCLHSSPLFSIHYTVRLAVSSPHLGRHYYFANKTCPACPGRWVVWRDFLQTAVLILAQGSCKLQSQRVALPAGEKPCPLPDLCLIIPCRPSWNPSPVHKKALYCQPLDASGREKTTSFGSGRGQTDIAKWDASLPQPSWALRRAHLPTLPQNLQRPRFAMFLSSSMVNYVGKKIKVERAGVPSWPLSRTFLE